MKKIMITISAMIKSIAKTAKIKTPKYKAPPKAFMDRMAASFRERIVKKIANPKRDFCLVSNTIQDFYLKQIMAPQANQFSSILLALYWK